MLCYWERRRENAEKVGSGHLRFLSACNGGCIGYCRGFDVVALLG